MTLDKHAVQTLTKTFWTPAGWRRDAQASYAVGRHPAQHSYAPRDITACYPICGTTVSRTSI